MSRHQSFTEKRRARLARRINQLDALEPRNTITESLWSLGLGIGFSAPLAAIASMTAGQKPAVQSDGLNAFAAHQRQAHHLRSYAQRIHVPDRGVAATRSAATVEISAGRKSALRTGKEGDWLTLAVTHTHKQRHHIQAAPARHASPGQAGSSSLSRGGVTTVARGAITPFRVPPPPAPQSDASSAMVATALISANTLTAGQNPIVLAPSAASSGAAGTGTASGPLHIAAFPPSGGGTGKGGGGSLTGLSSGSPQALGQFTNFPLYVLDENDGSVLFPGAYQLSTKGTNVDLRAQVRDTTVSSYSWDTSGITGDVTNLSVTNTYKLTFRWTGGSPTTHVDTITLTVTNTSNQTQIETLDFLIPASSTYSGGGVNAPTWPEATEPNLILPYAPSFQNHYVSVDSTSGSLDTTIALPSYNPNIPPVVLTYDSMAADPRPIAVEHHTLDDTQSIPTKDSAQLTFNGTAGGTYYFDTSQFIPGDIQQIGLQADATGLSTGRYSYTVTVADYRATTTTTTASGTATVLNQASSPIGSGWEVQGLEQITSATGGAILDVGSGGKTLWFASAGSGGGYTSPGGDFSTLVQNSGGTYTRTMPDGTVYNFDSNGRETSLVSSHPNLLPHDLQI